MNQSDNYVKKCQHYNEVLNEYFGYAALKDKQAEIIYNLLENKRDVCGILTTGFGKSICFQLPMLITKKSVLVVSPLIALMEDQKQALQARGIPVCCFNGNNWNKNKDKAEILNGNPKIIYTTPEYLVTESSQEFIEELVEKDLLCLFAIDESHCISDWGHDFRAEYLELSLMRTKFPNIPMVALTATATHNVEGDISHYLKMNNPLIIKSSFDRPNLFISLQPKTKSIINDLQHLIEKFKDDFIIIYCKKREDTETIRDVLRAELGCRVKAYHAGLPGERRNKIQTMFIQGRYKIIISTIAFGMGIDQTIRCVIHYGVSKSMESYYQEIGRAGRDGLPSECYLFYSHQDFIIYNHFLKDIDDSVLRKRRENEIKTLQRYVYLRTCRRKYILEYFGEKTDVTNCKNCDNCQRDIPTADFTEMAYILIKLLRRTNSKFGSGTLISVIRGSKSKKLQQSLKDLELYGSGKKWSEAWWKAFIRVMVTQSYLTNKPIKDSYGSVLGYTSKARDWYKKLSKIKFLEISSSLDNTIDKKFRLIFNLSDDLEALFPKESYYNQPDLSTIDFTNPNDLDMLVNSESPECNIKVNTSEADIKKLSLTKRQSYILFHHNNLSIEEIAVHRKYKKQTIEDHIVEAYKVNLPLNLDKIGYSKQIYNLLNPIFKKLGASKLRPLKDNMPKTTTYFQIKMGLVDCEKNNQNILIKNL
ncbi:RQC domain [seawater metagenome]|uniref:RQC domain n=1 Tax=seawater metagenome TaxID=1561972 RepID=A0A5E8CM99_9ZZZZ